ncbi:arabinofuranosidase catalytic domain-containing protein [Actinospica robiniae]|uniref:arabinofuranosidase catalytic domain-containing protein n=1 Tax=Actinospica robiniae TaxID=304901 RepID=UPI00040C1B80|nr:arabinofuranosidase catalytic domain-containing protein [Actinospica robiniae]
MSLIPLIRRRTRLLAASLLAVAIAVPISAITTTADASATTGVVAAAATALPCDIYASGGTPCETAHSTTRALFASYNGPLYQIQRASDGSYLNISVTAAGGVANAAPQTSFCAGTTCTITKIYDQTANHNDLPISWGGYWKGPGPNGADVGANAMALPLTIGGSTAYGVKVSQGVGYRVDNAKNVPTGSAPEGVYMVTSSNYVDQYCCFDYGSGENSHTDTGNATMNAIEFGTACWLGGCTGPGPWVEADLENGMYSSNTGPNSSSYQGVNFPFVTAMEKNNGTSNFTLKYANATSAGLTTGYSGSLPKGYSPMKTDSSILLGTGGDNSNSGIGEFFEGAVTAGYPSDATEAAVQANIAAAGYSFGGSSGGGGTSGALHAVGAGKCLDDPNSTTTGGTQQQIYDCNGQANQHWTHTSSGQLTLTVNGTTECLDANNNGTANGTKAIIWTCNGGTNQQWDLNSNGTVTGVQSGLCLDVTGKATTDGALVELWACNGGTNQQWTLS